MVADPIGAYLQSSLSKHSSNGSQSAILQTKLQASAKRALLTRVEFEPAERQHSHMLQSLQNKYIVLGERDYAPTNGAANGSTNGASNGASNGAANGGGSGAAPSGRPQAPVSLSKKTELKLGWGNSSYPNGAGMVNMGNTCYLNSSLQALFHAPGLVRWLLEDGRHAARCTGGDQCTVCSMARTLRSTHQRQGGVVKPILIYSKLKLICKHFIHGRQEDAHEFVRHLLDSMQRCHLAALRATKLDSLSKETTPLNHLFGGYLKTQVTCLRCQHASRTFQHFQDLLVDVRQVSTVDDALHLYFKKERLDGADYKCEKCRMKVPATKKFFIDEAPLILCIQLKRFSLGGGKITKHLAFPNKLNVTRFMTRPPTQGQVVYTLVSLINHMGPSQNCGHYTAMAKAANGQVYLFDDASVRMTSLSNMLSTNAYVLMYEMTGSTRQLLLGNPPGTPATETSRPPSPPPPPPPPPPVQPARGPVVPAVPASPLQQGSALTNTANRSRISFTMTAPAIVVKRPLAGNKSAVLGRTVPIATATSTSATSTVTSTASNATGAASGGVAATVTALKAAVTKGPLVPYGTGDSGSDDDSDAENRAVRPPSKKASTLPTAASASVSASAGISTVTAGAGATVGTPVVGRRPSLTPPRVLTERQPRAPAATSPWTVRETAALASPSLNSEESVGSHGSVGCTSPWLVTEKEGGPTPAPRPVGAAVPPGWKVTPLPARSPQSDSFDPRPENRHTPPPVRRAGSVDSPDGPRHLLGKISRKLKSLAPRAEKRQLGEDVGRPAKRPRPAPGPATAPGAGGDGEGRKIGNSTFFDMDEASAAATNGSAAAAAVPPPPRPPGRSMPVVTEEGAIRHLSGSDTASARPGPSGDTTEGATKATAAVGKVLKGAGDGTAVTAEAGVASKSNGEVRKGDAHKDSHKDSAKDSYDSQKESQKESHKRKKEKSRERDSISERGDGASHSSRATSADIFSPSKERSKSSERSKSVERSSKSSERSTKSSERSSKSADPDRPSAASTGLKSPHPHRPAASDPTASSASTSAVASGQGGQWPDRPAARRHHDRHYRRRSRSSSESSSEDDRRRRPSSAPAASVLSHGSHGSGGHSGSHSGGGGSGDALAYLTSGAGLAGYGRGVTTWSGERPGLEREREREREERRRREELDDYNDEFDSGRVKKVRSHRERPSLDHNPFQRLQEERRHGSRRDRSPSSDRRRERHERRRRRDDQHRHRHRHERRPSR